MRHRRPQRKSRRDSAGKEPDRGGLNPLLSKATGFAVYVGDAGGRASIRNALVLALGHDIEPGLWTLTKVA